MSRIGKSIFPTFPDFPRPFFPILKTLIPNEKKPMAKVYNLQNSFEIDKYQLQNIASAYNVTKNRLFIFEIEFCIYWKKIANS